MALAAHVILGMTGYALIGGTVGEYCSFTVAALLSPPVLICAIVAALVTAVTTHKRSPFRRVNLAATISVFIAAAIIAALILPLVYLWVLSNVRIA